MSVHHSSLGRVAAKCRLTRSAGVATRIRLGMRRPGRGSPHRPLSVMIELKIDQKRRVTLTGIHSFPGACQSGLQGVPSRRRTYNGDDEEERRRRRSVAVVG